MADTGRLDLDQDLANARTVDLDGSYFKGFAGFKGDSGAKFHDIVHRLLNNARLQPCSGAMTICV